MDLIFTLFCVQVLLMLACLAWLTETARLKRGLGLGGGEAPIVGQDSVSLRIEKEDTVDEEAPVPPPAPLQRAPFSSLLSPGTRTVQQPQTACPRPHPCQGRACRCTFFAASQNSPPRARKSGLRSCKENTCPSSSRFAQSFQAECARLEAPDRARQLIREKLLKYARAGRHRSRPLFPIAEQCD